ncbi:MGMT family protein [Corynebacterium pseudotuberculosis]|uniref:Cysteine methyltransferase n=2 Tax=Corynebacterium pseudotuberculosis TaxID=1719 RepID=A0AAU8PSV2_CORPS|nr:MGMT family protein [Corynebacterium pseudotuberculosis]AEQ05668.1 cysteine methyltransferase [Corynebacterium pseudotuberculosis CIP 52.97]AFB71437.1 cysteine methyltransferase [Corynebacterium pseudotuberculosis 316]AFH89943.1 cysteine methyltransferase [Corynebacterium pseudotuberculosis 31]AFK15756.1 cysteine methyltransferase [Corynebacterium pseudotuberculosis 258]AFM06476.1 cysteine methyltransferase [Corynebacterium pseudotuberculosis Cp162]
MYELDDLSSKVLDVVDGIPVGRVLSYGDIAEIVGIGPRQVGKIMATVGHLTAWWRVVRSDGSSHLVDRAVHYWDLENIAHNGKRVFMKESRWGCDF